MQVYKVFCADCHFRYEQGSKPYICGVCGSDWIAVKAITTEAMCGTVDDGFLGDVVTTDMYDH